MKSIETRRLVIRPIIMVALLVLCEAADQPSRTGHNSGQNPAYRLITNFPQLPHGWKLEAVSGVTTDSDDNVLIFHRGQHPIIVFDPNGKLIRSFGNGLFSSPHGLRVDLENNIWVTDNGNHTVTKFSRSGRVLLSLGEKDVAGEDQTHFNKPADVAIASNGDFYVADGYGNSRIVKFNREGKFLMSWGKKGNAPGEFNLPHAVRIAADNSVLVGDRENNRVQVFDPNGKFLREFGGLAPFGLFITPDQTIFVADGRANKVLTLSLDGRQLSSWGQTGAEPGNFQLPHGITVAKDGSVYVGEINGKRVQKFKPEHP